MTPQDVWTCLIDLGPQSFKCQQLVNFLEGGAPVYRSRFSVSSYLRISVPDTCTVSPFDILSRGWYVCNCVDAPFQCITVKMERFVFLVALFCAFTAVEVSSSTLARDRENLLWQSVAELQSCSTRVLPYDRRHAQQHDPHQLGTVQAIHRLCQATGKVVRLVVDNS
jgi:hypothetical protein